MAGDTYHYRFWAQTIRWLTKKQFGEGDTRARLSIDRTDCSVGESVEVEAFCLGEDGFPLENADVRIEVVHADGHRQEMAMQPAPDGWGIYRASVTPEREGRYTVRPLVAAYGDKPLSSSVSLQATRVDIEKHALAQNQGALMAIAQASGGGYLAVHEVGRLPSLLTARIEKHFLRAEYSPCRHWLYYVVLALLLAGAWFIGKRSGLA